MDRRPPGGHRRPTGHGDPSSPTVWGSSPTTHRCSGRWSGASRPFTERQRPRRTPRTGSQPNYAVDQLGTRPNTSVYLDGTHARWLGVGEAANRLIRAGVLRAQGFFLNVSNYQRTANSEIYGRWVSGCVAGATNPASWASATRTLPPASTRRPTSPVAPTRRITSPPWTPHTRAWASRRPHTSSSTPAATVRAAGYRRRYRPARSAPTRTTGASRPTVASGCEADRGHQRSAARRLPLDQDPGRVGRLCNRWDAPGSPDPVRGVMDPAAGQWFPDMAIELAHNANPQL